jgi:D-lyxose ketol-isomerase
MRERPTDKASVYEEIRADSAALIERCGFALSPRDWQTFRILDYGLGDVRRQGLQNVTLLQTGRIESKIQVLLPRQTVPEHCHPARGADPGKEESIRVLWGSIVVFIEGAPTPGFGTAPAGKEHVYTLPHGRILRPGAQITLEPGQAHWFQGGREGAVALSWYTRAPNAHTTFTDPQARFTAIEPKPCHPGETS